MSPGSAATLLAGRYRLDRQVAADRLGEVWQGTDLELARPVAVKLLHEDTDPDAASQFLTAARRAASVEHKGLVRVFDCGEPEPSESGQRPFLVMEYVDGQSLADLLHAGPLGAARTVDLIAQVTAALQVAHEAGLTHGDIRPEKILLGRDGAAKLFGFSGMGPAATASIGADLRALGLVARECLGEPTSPGGGGAPCGQSAASAAELAAELVAELCACASADHPDATAAIARRAAALRASPASTQPLPRLPAQAGSPAAPPTGPLPAVTAREGRAMRGRVVAACTAAIILLIAAAAIVGAINPGGKTQQAQGAAQAAAVRVPAASLIGRPVNLARLRLHRLGLITQIRWQHSGSVSPGDVVTVRPSGLVPVHSTVVIVGSSGPSAAGTTPGVGQAPTRRHRHQPRSATPSRSPTNSSTPTSSPAPSTSSTPAPSPSPSSSPAPSSSTASPAPSSSSSRPTNPPAPRARRS